ncbi:lipid-A-disaccharide synthase [Dyadobacter chenwenxiniae]|uniref:Lipid-A-disaccharide synthase n=1 Tax=Dyadobacter chenwenxiniae TaxID=2906456 RepID=A0A9X1PQ11_9BACT|nr:lipid-A-disaccharide synthase [Dyadobacter chenwenxiniae]MCF0063588.1 lipid-A-disaccharide synthase [Dyadobacter chenwenxiniae]UON83264.1 lipid-A-disaccharide synthase [Dyadobacter chenwenxiniae]
MKYYLIAGERSGDLHGSNLIGGIRENDPHAQFRGWGGDMMAGAGMDPVTHYKDTAFMGFLEVALNLHKISGFLKKCKADILEYKPDALILIDYPGFNLRIASFAKSKGLKVFYYISPKVWAWNQKRALKIKRNVDHMFVIFPFEIDFYKKFDYKVDYVGNPLMDAIAAFKPDPEFKQKNNLRSDKPIIALLPGSRQQEIIGMLDIMLTVQPHFPGHQFVIAGVSNLPKTLYEKYIAAHNAIIVYESTYDLLNIADAALVTSGTATLETALFSVPEVVCYKTSAFSYAIAKRLIRVPFISLVNLILEKEAVRELIQDGLNEDLLVAELRQILPDGAKHEQQMSNYETLKSLVGGPGASERAGGLIVDYLK